MHLTDVKRGFLGTSGIVGAGIPHAAGAAWAAQIRKKGNVVLCFFGDGASKQGAFHETLNIASLWKLPVIFVMENNGYNVVTTSAQEDANAAAGEPLSVKAKAYAMPGVTVDGTDPLAVHKTVGEAIERARAGQGPTLVESKVYRLSAHGNIIAPPGVPLHYPEHEAIAVFGKREEYEAALAWRPGAALPRHPHSERHTHVRQGGRAVCANRERDAGSRDLRAQESLPEARVGARIQLRVGRRRLSWHKCPISLRSMQEFTRKCARDPNVLYFGQNLATTENHEFVAAYGHDRVRVTPISETAEIGIAIGAAMAGLRPVVELYMAEFMLVAMDQVVNEAPRFRYMSGGQVKVPLGAQGRLRVYRRLGGPAHRLTHRTLHGCSGPQSRGALHGR